MKISVIIPTYNSAGTIERCLKSVSNQTCNDICEIIVVDDGSIDNTKDVVLNFKKSDNRIIYFYKKNSGVSSTRNFGIEHSTGDYITFVDSDDELKKEYIDSLAKKVNERTLVVGGIELHQDFGISNISNHQLMKSNKAIEEYGNSYSTLLLNGPCGKFFLKKIIFDNNLRFDPKVSLGEDTLFVFDYLKYCEFVNFIDCCGYIYYQLGTQSLMLKYREDAYFIAKDVYKRLVDDCETICGHIPINFIKVYKNVLNVYLRKLIANCKDNNIIRKVVVDYSNDDFVFDYATKFHSESFIGKITDWLTVRKKYFLLEYFLRIHIKIRGV